MHHHVISHLITTSAFASRHKKPSSAHVLSRAPSSTQVAAWMQGCLRPSTLWPLAKLYASSYDLTINHYFSVRVSSQKTVCGPLPDHHDGTSQASCISSYDLTIRSNLLVGSLLSPFDLCNTPKKNDLTTLFTSALTSCPLTVQAVHTFYHVHHRPHR
jgi:hypothetical protein